MGCVDFITQVAWKNILIILFCVLWVALLVLLLFILIFSFVFLIKVCFMFSNFHKLQTRAVDKNFSFFFFTIACHWVESHFYFILRLSRIIKSQRANGPLKAKSLSRFSRKRFFFCFFIRFFLNVFSTLGRLIFFNLLLSN